MGYKASGEKRFRCSDPDCGKEFDEPKVMLFCPHCFAELQDKKKGSDCPHFFGYLGLKEDDKGVPDECNDCKRTVECLLKKRRYSNRAIREIKKWF